MTLTPLDERLLRANTHVAHAAAHGHDTENKLAEALADLRVWAEHNGTSFSLAVDLARTKYIYDKVKARYDA